MELKLSQEETKAMLLEAVGKMFPGKFNKVMLSDFSEYSARGSAEFSFEEPIAPAPVSAAPASDSAAGEF